MAETKPLTTADTDPKKAGQDAAKTGSKVEQTKVESTKTTVQPAVKPGEGQANADQSTQNPPQPSPTQAELDAMRENKTS